MKHFYWSIIPLLILTGCGGGDSSSSSSSSSSFPQHDYSEVAHLTITYDQSFSINENAHYVYFYQETCHNCNDLKNEVIDFALKGIVPFYFIVATEDIPSNYSYQDINRTRGSSNVDDIFVKVVPQLAYIVDGKINKNIIFNINIEEELSHYIN